MPKFQHVGVSSLRVFTGKRLAALTSPVVICDHAEPIAALEAAHKNEEKSPDAPRRLDVREVLGLTRKDALTR